MISHLLNEIRSNCSILYSRATPREVQNPSLVEAMLLGLNVAAFDVGYNRATTDEQAAYFADVEELTCLVTNNPVNNAVAMKKIALEKYTWNAICEKYEDLL